MTSYFEHNSRRGQTADEDTVEFVSPIKVIEHVDSSTIVEVSFDRDMFMKAYHEAVRRQNNG